jgi:hypothetical protein
VRQSGVQVNNTKQQPLTPSRDFSNHFLRAALRKYFYHCATFLMGCTREDMLAAMVSLPDHHDLSRTLTS